MENSPPPPPPDSRQTGTPDTPVETPPQRSANPLKTVRMVLMFLIIAFTLSSLGLYYENNNLKNAIKQKSSVKEEETKENEWKIYQNYGFWVEYPADIALEAKNNKVRLFSEPVTCMTETGGSDEKVTVHELEIIFTSRSTGNFQKTWKDIFGVEFNENSYNGIMTIADKEVYFVLQKTSPWLNKQAILLSVDDTRSLEIDIYTPEAVKECSHPLKNMTQVREGIIKSVKIEEDGN